MYKTIDSHEITIKQKTRDCFYITVVAPDGLYCYDGYWEQEGATFTDALVEAVRGSCMDNAENIIKKILKGSERRVFLDRIDISEHVQIQKLELPLIKVETTDLGWAILKRMHNKPGISYRVDNRQYDIEFQVLDAYAHWDHPHNLCLTKEVRYTYYESS